MAKLSPINDRQRQLLTRIAAGGQPVTRFDSALVLTVNALSARGLVVKEKAVRGSWNAVATEAGRKLLEEPVQPRTEKAAKSRTTSRSKAPEPDSRSPESGRVVTELVTLPSRWPAPLTATALALQREEGADGRVRIERADHVYVNVPVDLRDRTLGVLAALTTELDRLGIAWRRTKSVSSYLRGRHHSAARQVGALGFGLADDPVHLEIREVSWWSSQPAGRLAVYAEGRSWPERPRANGHHFFDARKAAEGVQHFIAVSEERQRVAEEKAREEARLDALYAEERQEELSNYRAGMEYKQLRDQLEADAAAWEGADRLRRYAAAIVAAHPGDVGWLAWKVLAESQADFMDPLLNDASAVDFEVSAEEAERELWQLPAKRPTYWRPSSQPVKRRRRRRPTTGG